MRELTRCPPAALERRFHAAVLDLLVLALGALAPAYAVHRLGADLPTVLGVGVGALLVAAVLEAVALGLTGSSPGRTALGIRTVGIDGVPVGAGPALLRAAVLAVAGVATLGAGLAVFAWTALVDPSGWRRGWHDRLLGTVVLDLRRAPAGPEDQAPAHPAPINLTAMRLLPAPAPLAATSAATSGATSRAASRKASRTAARTLPAPVAASPAAARWRVRFDTGESFVVEGLTLIGGDPEAGVEPVRRRVVLGPGDASVSRTDARLQVVAGGTLVIMDRGSTPGTVLLRGGAPRELAPGRPTTLLAHDRVRFGAHLMEVLREG
ncbi:hypothetical protein GHK92_02075 [Nocardioides sp. dk4132]|uniref:RDD family protein n=1 Tax=unclassified Nocardioides TaxID=2615069 RepID=UPI001297F07D|nr:MULTISPECIES: RDD family protein [unclassified Nocardioides]MQW74649.1 hypothetical protein [Nocardioides sp. dk4132]QGA06562.1 hypothetical protein GFH29_03520 [Nocardioides sp. dk884]